jgi:oligoendopeptidase F
MSVSNLSNRASTCFFDKDAESQGGQSGAASDQRWDLSDLYASADAWNEARLVAAAGLGALADYEGRLGESGAVLADFLTAYFDAQKVISQLYTYASLAADQDLRESTGLERQSLIQGTASQFGQTVSFVEPELIALGAVCLRSFVDDEVRLAPYDHYLSDLIRQQKHVLTDAEEKILAAASESMATANAAYRVLSNADIDWPRIELSTGETVLLDASGYGNYRQLDSREDRERVFRAFFEKHHQYRNTFATTLQGQVKNHIFSSRVRGYDSCLERALDGENIPAGVYRTLVQVVNDSLPTLHRYFRLRGRMLGIEDLRYFDIYPELVDRDLVYKIDQCKAITLDAVRPLGNEYVSSMADALDKPWMDVYPREGKRSGAYMAGSAYDVHPYLMLNHHDDYNSLSTFAHEWGHAMHSLLSNEAQPFAKASYATFVAEVASIVNETLLSDRLIANAEAAGDDETRLFFLTEALEGMRGTFFRQTMFGEFELNIHEEVEQGGALSGDKLTQMYGDILRRYHGHDEGVLTIDDVVCTEWGYIPHFYMNFYVYQYATSMAAAFAVVERIRREGDVARQAYLAALSAGGSAHPYEILKEAGLDMADASVYQAVVNRMDEVLDQVEALL